MPLSVNPNQGDSRQAFIRNGFVVGAKKDFSRSVLKNLKFSKEDFRTVKSKIRNYKKKTKKVGDQCKLRIP